MRKIGNGSSGTHASGSLSESHLEPTIWAEPSTRVTNGNAVTIWCKGPMTATHYQLYFEGSFSALERPSRSTNRVNFTIPQMTSHTAGKYTCCYQSGERQSKSCKGLNLIVTGLYDTPNLWVHSGPEVTLGENVTFFCHLETGTSKFFLIKEGRSNRVWHRLGNIKAEFPMGPMTRAHRGTYRCFGSYNDHVWSFPSKPVTLLIPGDVDNTSLAPTDPTSLDYWEYNLSAEEESGLQKAQNLIRIGLACIVLMTLVWLLVEDWLSRKRNKEGTNRSPSWEYKRRWRVHCSLEEGERNSISMREPKATPGPGSI